MTGKRLGQSRIFLSSFPARPSDWQQAGASVTVFLLIFAGLAPVAQIPLPQVWAFIPSYQAALAVNDLVTSILLLSQFAILRSISLLALALGYLFTALMAISHGLSFPGLFAPEGLLGAGPQTTAWLYMAWHAGFPMGVMAYTATSGDGRTATRPPWAIAAGGIVVIAIVCGVTLLATAGHSLLPSIMQGNHYTGAMYGTIAIVWGLSLAALLQLAWRRPHSVLDLWLMVVLVAWLCDIGLSVVLNAGRFDLGFYAGRVFGLLAASFVLIVLLLETGALYARLATSFERESAEQEDRLQELQQELIHVARVSELGQMAQALSHELNQPLTAAGTYLAAAKELLQAGNVARGQQMLVRAAGQVTRAGEVVERVRLLVRKGEVARRPDDLAATVNEAAALAFTGGQAAGIHLQLIVDAAMPAVLIDRVQIQQVLLNLMRNAIEALAASPRREIVVRTGTTVDGMAEITVADTGPGLGEGVRERLFQPFVTTKATGLGIGLSICRSIIESHGGRIWISDSEGGGTVFHFTVPYSEAAATDRADTAGAAAAAST